MKENKKNIENEKVLTYLLVIVFCALIGLLAISSITGHRIGQTTPEPLTKKVTTADNVRKIEKLELVEKSNWEQVPYVMFQPDQLLADIAKVEDTDSKIEFPYEYNGNIVFTIGKSSISDKPYICINNVEENGNTMNRYFDLNKWSIFKANNNIIFATTDYIQGGLNEEFHFVEIDKSGNAKVQQIKFIDLLGYDEEYDEICTLPGIEATLVRNGNNLKIVRDGIVLDDKIFPNEIKKEFNWSTDSYFLGDDGTLYYVLIGKDDSDHPTINCVKAGEGVSPRAKIQVAFDENGQKWNVFTDESGKDIVFVMDANIWKDCSIASNRLTNIEEPDDTHIPSSEWKISKVELETPQRFSLEYEQVKHTDQLQAAVLNEKDRAWWNIKFYYNDNIYTISAVPGIDENIFLDDEDVKTFGKDYEMAELNAIREEMAVMYKKYVDEAYENYLKN